MHSLVVALLLVFAFANQDGSRLMSLSDDHGEPRAEPQKLDRALCTGSRVFKIAFEARQAARPGDTGCQVSGNFERAAGDVYRLVDGKVDADEPCLIGPQEELIGVKPIAVSGWKGLAREVAEKPPSCGARDLELAASAVLGRAVTECAVVGRIEQRPLLAVEYKRSGEKLLAALVLGGQESPAVIRYPATCRADNSGWRVDDECRLDPGGFAVWAAWEQDGQTYLALEWAGAEGGALSVLRARSGQLDEIVRGYRYWMPL